MENGKMEFINEHQEYLNHYINLADNKATALIIINGLLINLSLTQKANFLLYSEIVLLVFGIVCSAFIILPRTSNKAKKGLIFWGNIVEYSKNEYTQELTDISLEDLISKRIEQNYFLAQTANSKYKLLKIAFYLSFCAYILLGIIGIISIY